MMQAAFVLPETTVGMIEALRCVVEPRARA
jgi:hypothetical protein